MCSLFNIGASAAPCESIRNSHILPGTVIVRKLPHSARPRVGVKGLCLLSGAMLGRSGPSDGTATLNLVEQTIDHIFHCIHVQISEGAPSLRALWFAGILPINSLSKVLETGCIRAWIGADHIRRACFGFVKCGSGCHQSVSLQDCLRSHLV